MEQSQNQSSISKFFFKTLRFLGIFLLNILIVYSLGANGLGVINKIEIEPVFLFSALFIVLPLVWAFSKTFILGFIRYVAIFIAIVLIGTQSPGTISLALRQIQWVFISLPHG
jgi:hypothetical protein